MSHSKWKDNKVVKHLHSRVVAKLHLFKNYLLMLSQELGIHRNNSQLITGDQLVQIHFLLM